jgi:hypothetical protein
MLLLRRQPGNDYLTLLQFLLNHRRYLRSGNHSRVGKSPAELLTGETHPHWLELLGYTRFSKAVAPLAIRDPLKRGVDHGARRSRPQLPDNRWARLRVIRILGASGCRLRSSPQPRQRLCVPRALGQHLVPEPPGLGKVAALGGQRCQVAPGDVAVDPLIKTAKPIRAF